LICFTLGFVAMAASPDQEASWSELEASREALAAALADPATDALFGEPVDTAALPDYLTVIQHPKDLGTVLADVEKSLQGAGPYLAASDVYTDVLLVWSNCERYNSRPEDKEIVKVCKRSAALVAREWRKAGLDLPEEEELIAQPASQRKGASSAQNGEKNPHYILKCDGAGLGLPAAHTAMARRHLR